MTARTLGLALTCVVAAGVRPAAAQDEAALRSFFEGRYVVVRIDMPGDANGVDVRPGSAFDGKQYSDRLKRYGTSIRAGDRAKVTVLKVKKDLIEFQLDGGGYGTFSDDTSTTVDMPQIEKSNREKDLEQLVKTEVDAGKRRTYQRELDDLRNARERENRRITSEKARAEEDKKARLADRRAAGGSRFNLRYSPIVPATLAPRDVMTALAEYVDFSGDSAAAGRETTVPVSSDAVPRKGMLRAEAERLFGRPTSAVERREGSLRVVTVVFLNGDQRISAEFVEDVLIRYSVTPR